MEVKEVSRVALADRVNKVDGGVYMMPNEKEDLNWLLNTPNLRFYYIETGKPWTHDIFVIETGDPSEGDWRYQSVKWWILTGSISLTVVEPDLLSHRMWGSWTRQRYLLIDNCTGYTFSTCIEDMARNLQELKAVLQFQGSDFS